ncbi:hypothetical protein [Synechocystis sp. CACIAM 05]|uniref:hypothetical protein n=1 Tax=Synechocystis sp. CACIAM 05 TaxID=1933929 RepID=UPI001950F29F|nr:hypothetical protein [Synechocystis sp. CACIAM 05]
MAPSSRDGCRWSAPWPNPAWLTKVFPVLSTVSIGEAFALALVTVFASAPVPVAHGD